MDSLKVAMQRVPVQVQAFVLMEDHYQLLVWTPNEDLDRFMFEFNRTLSKKLRNGDRRRVEVFSGRYKWSLLSNKLYQCRLKLALARPVFRLPMDRTLKKVIEEYKNLNHGPTINSDALSRYITSALA
jgi:putative transposase